MEQTSDLFIDSFVFDSKESLEPIIEALKTHSDDVPGLTLPISVWMSNNGDAEEEEISIGIYNSVLKGYFHLWSSVIENTSLTSSKSNMSIMAICAHANLISSCDEMCEEGVAFDILAVAGLCMFEKDMDIAQVDDLGKNALCTSLYYAINW